MRTRHVLALTALSSLLATTLAAQEPQRSREGRAGNVVQERTTTIAGRVRFRLKRTGDDDAGQGMIIKEEGVKERRAGDKQGAAARRVSGIAVILSDTAGRELSRAVTDGRGVFRLENVPVNAGRLLITLLNLGEIPPVRIAAEPSEARRRWFRFRRLPPIEVCLDLLDPNTGKPSGEQVCP